MLSMKESYAAGGVQGSMTSEDLVDSLSATICDFVAGEDQQYWDFDLVVAAVFGCEGVKGDIARSARGVELLCTLVASSFTPRQ